MDHSIVFDRNYLRKQAEFLEFVLMSCESKEQIEKLYKDIIIEYPIEHDPFLDILKVPYLEEAFEYIKPLDILQRVLEKKPYKVKLFDCILRDIQFDFNSNVLYFISFDDSMNDKSLKNDIEEEIIKRYIRQQYEPLNYIHFMISMNPYLSDNDIEKHKNIDKNISKTIDIINHYSIDSEAKNKMIMIERMRYQPEYYLPTRNYNKYKKIYNLIFSDKSFSKDFEIFSKNEIERLLLICVRANSINTFKSIISLYESQYNLLENPSKYLETGNQKLYSFIRSFNDLSDNVLKFAHSICSSCNYELLVRYMISKEIVLKTNKEYYIHIQSPEDNQLLVLSIEFHYKIINRNIEYSFKVFDDDCRTWKSYKGIIDKNNKSFRICRMKNDENDKIENILYISIRFEFNGLESELNYYSILTEELKEQLLNCDYIYNSPEIIEINKNEMNTNKIIREYKEDSSNIETRIIRYKGNKRVLTYDEKISTLSDIKEFIKYPYFSEYFKIF